MRSLIWFLAAAIALVIVVCGGALIFLKTHANGFSARARPSVLESWAARQARAMALPTGALDTHIEDVVNLIRWEELSDVVLCGHSYGGWVISGVANRIPDRIMDAFVLEDGENLLRHVHESQRNRLLEGARNIGDGWKVPPSLLKYSR